ncbi:MAG: hypothetical protein JWN86_3606 [Planctomycetota bacterium]|nr:hypothetical protein [Planctomycetota bacterium]
MKRVPPSYTDLRIVVGKINDESVVATVRAELAHDPITGRYRPVGPLATLPAPPSRHARRAGKAQARALANHKASETRREARRKDLVPEVNRHPDATFFCR